MPAGSLRRDRRLAKRGLGSEPKRRLVLLQATLALCRMRLAPQAQTWDHPPGRRMIPLSLDYWIWIGTKV
jgi:hypothetical protein